jgi:GxxExxY protein
LEFEFNNELIDYEPEKEYTVNYKGITLPHSFYADFIVFDNVILKVKGKTGIANEDIAMAINYLKVSRNKIALIVNFGEQKLDYKRIIL